MTDNELLQIDTLYFKIRFYKDFQGYLIYEIYDKKLGFTSYKAYNRQAINQYLEELPRFADV